MRFADGTGARPQQRRALPRSLAALYHPPGGIIRHDAVVWGYARACDRMGIEIHPLHRGDRHARGTERCRRLSPIAARLPPARC